MTEAVAADQLRTIVERVERMNGEKEDINADIKAIYDEARSNGFNVKIVKEVIRLRKMDHDDRQERDAVLSLYLEALGS